MIFTSHKTINMLKNYEQYIAQTILQSFKEYK